MDHLTGGIELDHQRRQTPVIQFTVQHVLAIEKENVVLRIDAMSAEPARNPSIRKPLREGDIDLVARRGTLRPTGGHPKTRGHDRRYGGDTYSDDAAHFHESCPPRTIRDLLAHFRPDDLRPRRRLTGSLRPPWRGAC